MKRLLIAILLVMFTALSTFAADVKLAWDPNSPLPDGYHIYQKIAGHEYDYDHPVVNSETDEHGAIPSVATEITVTDLVPGTTYNFVIRAFVGSGESGNSEEVAYDAIILAPENFRIISELEVSVTVKANGEVVLAQTTTTK